MTNKQIYEMLLCTKNLSYSAIATDDALKVIAINEEICTTIKQAREIVQELKDIGLIKLGVLGNFITYEGEKFMTNYETAEYVFTKVAKAFAEKYCKKEDFLGEPEYCIFHNLHPDCCALGAKTCPSKPCIIFRREQQ